MSEATDRWHKARLAPGDVPCAAPACRAGTAPTPAHGKGDRWAATWDVVIDGKRKQRSRTFRYHPEAAAFQQKMRTGVRDKSLPPDLRLRGGFATVGGFFPQFMELTARDRSIGSHGKVRSQFTRMIEPHLGGWDLADLQYKPNVIREWQFKLRDGVAGDGTPGRAYASGTIGEAFGLLSGMFEHALGDRDTTGVITNPCKRPQAKRGKADRKRGKRLAEWDAPKVAAAYLAPMPERAARGSMPAWVRYRTPVLLAATTGGMRLGEVMALDPEDIDWDRQLITMHHSLARDHNGGNHFRDGKSDASQRVMTAAPLVLAALAAHMETFRTITVTLPLETAEMYGRPMIEWPLITRTLIFSTGAGSLVSDPAYQSAARYGLCQAGLIPARPIAPRPIRDTGTGRYAANGGPQRAHHVSERYERPSDHGLHFHALRHLYVSLLHDWHVPETIIQNEVGHEQLSSSQGTGVPDGVTAGYTHPVPDKLPVWRRTIRERMTAEFGPLLPELAADMKPRRLRLA